MNPKTYLTVGVIAASCALPASASAATTSAGANVRADARASVQAFENVKVLTEAGRDGAAAAKLRLGLRELRAAARTTARMRLNADTNAELMRVVRAERRIGESADVGADVLADVVAQADVAAQVKLASAISSLLMIHQQAIEALAATVEVASDVVDAVAVKAIVELSANANSLVSAISDALVSADVSVDAAVKLNAALSLATETVSASLAVLQKIPAITSATVHGAVNVAIGQVTGALVQAQSTLRALAGTVAAIGTDAVAPIVLPTLNSLLGSVSLALSADAHAHVGGAPASSSGAASDDA